MKKVEMVKIIARNAQELAKKNKPEDNRIRREAQRIVIEAAQYGADISNEKANNMAKDIIANINDEAEKVAKRFTKEELTQIADYIGNMDTKDEFEEKCEIAKAIIKEVKSVEMTEAGEEAIVRSVVEEFTQLTGDDAYAYTIQTVTGNYHFMAEHSTKEELEAMLQEFVSCISDNNEGEDLDAHDRMIDEMDKIAESNKAIIEQVEVLRETHDILNKKRNRKSARMTDIVTHNLILMGYNTSEVTEICIKIHRKEWKELTHTLSFVEAKILRCAVKKYDTEGR